MNIRFPRPILRKWSDTSKRRRPRVRPTSPAMEILEDRQLLATVYWISSTSGDWNTKADWSSGNVPGPSDDAVINVTGATPTVTISTGNQSVHSIAASDPLSITGGSLTVASNSTISDGLSMTGGTLEANGSGISLDVTGTATVAGANLYAEGGANLTITGMTSYQQPDNYGTDLLASGSGSVLSLPNVQSISFPNGYGYTYVQALSGGDLELPALTQSIGDVVFQANSPASVLDLADLATVNGGTIDYSGGTLNSPGSTTNLPLLTDFDSSTLDVSGGVSLSPSTITSAKGSDFYASGGASLTITGLSSYQQPYNYGTTLQASGTGSVLSLPNVQSISFPNGYGYTYVQDLSGGDLELPALTQSIGNVIFQANNAASVLDLADLATVNGGTIDYSGGTLNSSGSTTNLPLLTDFDSSTLDVSGGASLSPSTIASAKGSDFYASGGASLTITGLSSYQQPYNYGTTLQASGTGSVLSLPNVQSISFPNGYGYTYVQALSGGDLELPALTESIGDVVFQANNAASVLDLADLATVNGGTIDYSGGTLNSSGSTTNLPLLTDFDSSTLDVSGGASLSPSTITSAKGSDFYASGGASLTITGLSSYQQPYNYGIALQASGTGSVLSLPNVQSISFPNGYGVIYVQAYSGGDVELPALTQSTGNVNLQTNSATSTIDVPLLASFIAGTINDGGGTINLPLLSDVDGSDFYVNGGATLTLADLTSYQQPYNYGIALQASGTGSVLSLPNVQSISFPNGYGGHLRPGVFGWRCGAARAHPEHRER